MTPRRDCAISELRRRYTKADSTLHDKKIQSWAETVEYNEDQTRMLEEELIETKLRMATAKSREDYLLLEIQQLKESLAQKDSVIEDLQRQLAKFHVCTNFPLFKDETLPTVSPTTYMVPVHEAARRDIKKITMAPTRMPSETSLKCHDESTVVSALTFYSDAFEDIMLEEDLLNAFSGEEYQVSLRDETQRVRRSVPIMSRQPSCASGIAFMMNYHSRVSESSSKGREGVLSAEQENEQEESDRDASKQDAYCISSMSGPASCASGIAFMSGDVDIFSESSTGTEDEDEECTVAEHERMSGRKFVRGHLQVHSSIPI